MVFTWEEKIVSRLPPLDTNNNLRPASGLQNNVNYNTLGGVVR